jgi:chorismate dehydratase
VHCDTDSHTSVALMQVILRERYGLTPELVDYYAREHVAENRPIEWPDAMLLIGDKVVLDSPPAVRYPHQLDLGAAWVEHTSLPFVFAVWLAKRDADPARVATAAAVLDRQRRANREQIDTIIHRRARPRGWPPDLASTYLKRSISYAFDDDHRRGLELFFDRAAAHGLVPHHRPLETFEPATLTTA